MCGIIAHFHSKEKKDCVNEKITNQFQDQLDRGTEGFGLITIDEKDFKTKVFRATEMTKAIIDLYMKQAKMAIFHHRMPSSSDNKISQTHPIFVSHENFIYDYYIIHNGCINNGKKLKKEHEKQGFKYTTEIKVESKYYSNYDNFNDSESLAIELAKFIENQSKEIKAIGSAAFIVLQISKENGKAAKVFFGRNYSNPLKMSKTRDKLYLSSEGEGDNIKENVLYSFNPENLKLKKKKILIQTNKVTKKENSTIGYQPKLVKTGEESTEDNNPKSVNQPWFDQQKNTEEDFSYLDNIITADEPTNDDIYDMEINDTEDKIIDLFRDGTMELILAIKQDIKTPGKFLQEYCNQTSRKIIIAIAKEIKELTTNLTSYKEYYGFQENNDAPEEDKKEKGKDTTAFHDKKSSSK